MYLKLCRIITSVSFLLIIYCPGKAQGRLSLSIGDKVPAAIFNGLPKKAGTRLIILDFWSSSCTSCMAAFPKMQKLQTEFNQALQVVFINSYETVEMVQKRFIEKKGRKWFYKEPPVNIPAIYGDSIWKSLFPHQSIPHHVWIDGQGKVLAITSGYNATASNVQGALDGKKLNFSVKNDLAGYNMAKEGWMKPVRKELPEPHYYTSFMPYYSGIGNGVYITKDSANNIFRKTYRNLSVVDFYRIAYDEKNKLMRVLIESDKKDEFKRPTEDDLRDAWHSKHFFSYEIRVPVKDEEQINNYLKTDINRFFGSHYGIEGNWEKRTVKTFVLVKSKNDLLKTAKGKQSQTNDESGYHWINYPFNQIVNILYDYIEDFDSGIAFIDETFYTGNVDMHLTGDLKNISNLRKQLQLYGLDLKESNRELDVLIIKDK